LSPLSCRFPVCQNRAAMLILPFRRSLVLLFCATAALSCTSRTPPSNDRGVHLSEIGLGWAQSSVNAVVFRQSSVVSHGDLQYAAYYDPEGRLVLARRRLGSDDW